MMQKRLDRRVDKMTERLDLTNQQAEQLRKALRQTATERRALRQKHRREMKALHQKTRNKLESILTGEQASKLDELRRERRARRVERGAERLGRHLGLTDQQQEQVEAILGELQTEIHDLRQNEQLEGKEKHRQARQLFQQAASDIEALLDETQTAEFQKVKHRLRHKLVGGKRGHHGK
jgi:Spy/CpxP family protein refolding chaperone